MAQVDFMTKLCLNIRNEIVYNDDNGTYDINVVFSFKNKISFWIYSIYAYLTKSFK